MTTVSSSTVLSNTSSIFVYIFGIIVLPDVKFSYLRVLFILFSFAGVTIITLQGEDDGKDSLKGDLLSLLSAVFYGLYAVFLKR
jgi:solute carrier family 35 protein F5